MAPPKQCDPSSHPDRDFCLSVHPPNTITLSAIDILWVYITLLGNRHLPKIEFQPCHLTLPWPHVSGTLPPQLQTTRHCSMLVSLPPVVRAMLSSHKKATFVTWLLCPPYLWLWACDREKKEVKGQKEQCHLKSSQANPLLFCLITPPLPL